MNDIEKEFTNRALKGLAIDLLEKVGDVEAVNVLWRKTMTIKEESFDFNYLKGFADGVLGVLRMLANPGNAIDNYNNQIEAATIAVFAIHNLIDFELDFS